MSKKVDIGECFLSKVDESLIMVALRSCAKTENGHIVIFLELLKGLWISKCVCFQKPRTSSQYLFENKLCLNTSHERHCTINQVHENLPF